MKKYLIFMTLHHFVPQFYLKNFAISPTEPVLWVYRRTGTPQKLPIKTIAAVRNLYQVTIAATGEKSERLERIFAELEGDVKPLIDRLLAIDSLISLSPKEVSLLSYFMALLYLRGRSFRAKAHNLRIEILKRHLMKEAENPDSFRALARRAGYEISDQELELMRHSVSHFDDHFTLTVKRGEDTELLEMMFDLAKQISLLIFNKHWQLYHSAQKIFITSDNPLTVMQYNNTPRTDSNIFTNGIVAWPLSPSKCLLLEPGRINPRIRVSTADRATVSKVNRSTMFNAHREVYSRFGSPATAKAFQRTVEGWSEELQNPDEIFERITRNTDKHNA
ncbi:MAG: DUF4238 domain-containing protein [Acidobacteria bacterium]|nr:DUF4238 domain-containing protein [Acidobacteriota bacterium]